MFAAGQGGRLLQRKEFSCQRDKQVCVQTASRGAERPAKWGESRLPFNGVCPAGEDGESTLRRYSRLGSAAGLLGLAHDRGPGSPRAPLPTTGPVRPWSRPGATDVLLESENSCPCTGTYPVRSLALEAHH